MILGDTCTRNCRFCGVRKLDTKPLSFDTFAASKPHPSGCDKDAPLSINPQASRRIDLEEPYRLAETIKELNLNYAVITSVTRDDLLDGGAEIFAKTIQLTRRVNKNIKIEVLIPDFKGSISSLKCILTAQPQVVAHNIETVERLYADLRPEANYQLSLDILRNIKEIQASCTTKSSIMLGLGETEEEVLKTMEDLVYSGCDILTLGQYLAPSKNHYPVKGFISIEQFERYRDLGLGLGFKSVLSGPLVRSSYQAEEIYKEVNEAITYGARSAT